MKSLDLSSIRISGLNQIEASAGTGKTWTIAALYILILLEKELKPEQILVVTYTKAATAELRERIRRRISTTLNLYASGRVPDNDELEKLLVTTRTQDSTRAKKLLSRALYSFDDAAIYTIHAFCQRVLMENAFESGALFGSDMISDQSAVVKQVCDDFWRSRILSQHEYFLEHLVINNFTPDKLAKPFKGQFQNPYIHIIPQEDEIPLEPNIHERDRLYCEACNIWRAERNTILQLLVDARLNQQSYKPEQVIAAADSFDLWSASNNASLPNSKLDFFSARKITSKKTKASPMGPDHKFFTLCQQLSEVISIINIAFNTKIIACQHEFKKWLEVELAKRKKMLNQRAYDDLLLDLHLALESETGTLLAEKLRNRYKATMIDEFQDTDPLQWNIFKRIGDESDYPLFLIGDPKQAIYSFRGADIFAYLSAGKQIAINNRHTLGINFRSEARLINAVCGIFSAVSNPFKHDDIPFNPVVSGRSIKDLMTIDGATDNNPFKIWVYQNRNLAEAEVKPVATLDIAKAVADEIARLLTPGRVSFTLGDKVRALAPGDISLLVKSHRQAEIMQDALNLLGIPSVQQGNSTIYETPEALDLLRILRAAAEPHRESLVREALLTHTIGLDINLVASYVQIIPEHPDWETWLLHFQNLHKTAEYGGIVALISRLLGGCGIRERLLSSIGGERCLTNILHCSELLHQIESKQGKSLTGLITWLEKKISSPTGGEESLLRLETDENSVVISTIHASKGLQYPIVFVPFAWDATSPSSKPEYALFHNDKGELVLDLANEEEHQERAQEEQKAEATRLLYVALTRAEFRCYLVWGAINSASSSPLFQLLHGKSKSVDCGNFPKLSNKTIIDDISANFENSGNGISVEPMPIENSNAPEYSSVEITDKPYKCRTALHTFCDDWRVASFSSMTAESGHVSVPQDHDSMQGSATVAQDADDAHASLSNIFDFPRGAKAGTCLHEIFEKLDYANINSSSILTETRSSLAGNGFKDLWIPAVTGMLNNVLSAGIIPESPDFCLSQLKKGEWQTEMEFYLPINQIAPDSLRALFNGILDVMDFEDFFEVLNRLSFRQSRGMLQGFIDLIFVHNSRYYILDWKSNHLGMKSSDYNQENMHKSMCQSAYILQYHLYILALDRYLKLRLSGYCYEKHFGGILYLYLRGISPEAGTNGIYFSRPDYQFVQRAEKLILD